MTNKIAKLDILKALADETRLKIIEALKDKEMCACELVPLAKKSQPNVSLHLKKLEENGILKSRKEGTKVIYSIKDKRVLKILNALE
ncbi:MAG: metalloregulator ArsR/SmtB family transcription factor [Candidatus Woesearchaeota archaeon]